MAATMTDERGTSPEARRRAERRAFIRATHPDLGGDPDTFIAGMASFDPRPGAAPAGRPDRPLVHRSRRPDRVVRSAVRSLRRRISGTPPRNLH